MLALRILPVAVTVFNDREELDCCEHGVSPDGKRSDFDTIAVLSTWKHQPPGADA